MRNISRLMSNVLINYIQISNRTKAKMNPTTNILKVVPLSLEIKHKNILLRQQRNSMLITGHITMFNMIKPARKSTNRHNLTIASNLQDMLQNITNRRVLQSGTLNRRSIRMKSSILRHIKNMVTLGLTIIRVVTLFKDTTTRRKNSCTFKIRRHRETPRTRTRTTSVRQRLVDLTITIQVLNLRYVRRILRLIPDNQRLRSRLIRPNLISRRIDTKGLMALTTIKKRRNSLNTVNGMLHNTQLNLRRLLSIQRLIRVQLRVLRVNTMLNHVRRTRRTRTGIQRFANNRLNTLLLAPDIIKSFLPLSNTVTNNFRVLNMLNILRQVINRITAGRGVSS